MTIDNLTNINWKKYLEKKKEAERVQDLAKKANKIQPATLQGLTERTTDQDFLLVAALLAFFFDEVPNKCFNDFLADHGYTSEDYVRTMNKYKRLKEKLKE